MNAETKPSPPRWEWRTFSPRLVELRARFPGLDETVAKHSRETYLLCDSSRYNPKIRFEILDVKHLLDTDSNGLQLWTPVFKEAFPVDAPSVRRLLAMTGNGNPVLARERYTLVQFLEEVAGQRHGLRPVKVEKNRRAFEFEGCAAEFVEASFDGTPVESFCLEHHDPAVILRALDRLALRAVRNVSYPEAIRQAIGAAEAASS